MIALALLVRALIPAGYMFSWRGGSPTVEFCDGMVPAPTHDMAMMAHRGHGDGKGTPTKNTSKDELPCAFAAISASAAIGVDPSLLATAILFIFTTVAFGLLAQGRHPDDRPHLRPPLRGPPSHQ